MCVTKRGTKWRNSGLALRKLHDAQLPLELLDLLILHLDQILKHLTFFIVGLSPSTKLSIILLNGLLDRVEL